MNKIGNFHIVGPHAQMEGKAAAVILDTNILIHFARFFFKGSQNQARESLLKLLRAFPKRTPLQSLYGPSVDLIYGHALSEATWSRTGTFDALGHRRLGYAAWVMANWTPEQVEKEFSNKHPAVNKHKRWHESATVVAHAGPVGHSLELVMGEYATLLKAMVLEQKLHSPEVRAKRTAMEELAAWTRDDLGTVFTYSLKVGLDLLGGTRSRQADARRMLKLGGTETADDLAKKAWNAAWDVSFTKLTEGHTYGLIEGIEPRLTVLATENHDPYLLRLAAELRALIVVGDSITPVQEIHNEWCAGIDPDWVASLTGFDAVRDANRRALGSEGLADEALRSIHRLEDELGLAHTARTPI